MTKVTGVAGIFAVLVATAPATGQAAMPADGASSWQIAQVPQDQAGEGALPPSSPGQTTNERARLAELVRRSVVDRTGQEVGEVEDVLLQGPGGPPASLVIDLEGTEKDVAVPYSAVTADTETESVRFHAGTRDQLLAMSPFQYGRGTLSLNRAERRQEEAR